MRIGIFVSKKRAFALGGVRRLQEEIGKDGHEPVLFANEDISAGYTDGWVFNVPLPEVIIARPTLVSEPTLYTYALRAFAEAGVCVMNSADAVTLTKNKLHQKVALAAAGVPTPRFVIVRSTAEAERAAVALKYPVVLKVAFGTRGKGVFLAKQRSELAQLVDYLVVRDGNPVLLEEYVPEAGNGDARVFIVKGKVIAAMLRCPQGGEWRGNAAQGATCEAIELTEEETEVALRAVKATGLDIAGVDAVRTAAGFTILEVNANPGFTALEAATGVNVAAAVVTAAVA